MGCIRPHKMTEDDVSKLKAAALYVLQKFDGGTTDFIHLFKILYFSERAHYAACGMHLIRDTFRSLKYGPVPSFLYDAIRLKRGDALEFEYTPDALALLRSLSSAFAVEEKIVRAGETPDMDELSRAEIAALDAAVAEHKLQDFQTISDRSHDEAWEKARGNEGKSRSMSPYDIAAAGGASKEFVAYIREQEEIDEYLADEE